MGNVKAPAPLLPSFEEAGQVCRIGVRVAGVVGWQGDICAAERQVRVLTQTGGDFAGPSGGDVLLGGKKCWILGACLGDGLLQGQGQGGCLRLQVRARAEQDHEKSQRHPRD
jgi:hypothetical protein